MSASDLVGNKYGRLTVLERAGSDSHKQSLWLCMCDCGKQVVAQGNRMKRGNVRSCGCLKRQPKSHGFCGSPLYYIWSTMIQRCENPNNKRYRFYGARGILVCDEWHDPAAFVEWGIDAGYEKGLTIDRINNDGNYEPSNCRFITQHAQNRNTRKVCRIITESGYLTGAEAAKEIGVSQAAVCKWFTNEGLRTLDEIRNRAATAKRINYCRQKSGLPVILPY